MAEERKVYRRADNAPRPQSAPPRSPAPQKRRRKNKNGGRVLAICLACVVLAVLVGVVLARCGTEEGSPAAPDYGTPAGAWQKNELGYYFNTSGGAVPQAVLKGIDVSKYQGEVDWEKAKAAGIDFAVLRCGYGGEWDGQEQGWAQDDDQFRRNADECTRLGIPFGVYLYSYATTVEEARSEADHVARLLGLTAPPYEGLGDYTETPYQLSYPVYYDLEDKYISKVLPGEMAEIVQAFFDRLTEHGYSGKQGLYASLNWVRARLNDSAFDPWRENLWIARFSDELAYTGPYDMWQCTHQGTGADYGVQSETVDIDFVMRPFTLTGLQNAMGKSTEPCLVNDTRQWELHLAGKDDRATLTTNRRDEENQKVYWATSDKSIATVDKDGTVRARADSGECTVTGTLADGTETISCIVRVGDITIPVFATAGLQGSRERMADVAAQKAGTPDAVLLDAGNSLHGTTSASMTGGMDMLSAFSGAGYDLQAVSIWDMAYGTSRLTSDANMGAGPTLSGNLLDASGTPVLYRSTSWNRNRVTNGQYTIVERAGYKIGFFALNDTEAAGVLSSFNGEFVTARDFAESAAQMAAALRQQGADAVICIASTPPAGDNWQKTVLNAGADAIITTAASSDSDKVLAAGLGTDGLARLDLVFTQGGGCTAKVHDPVTAEELTGARNRWTNAAVDAADPEEDPAVPTERADQALQKGADAYAYATSVVQGLDADDQSIWYTPLFTYAENTDADKTISFGNYVASLYAEIAANDTAANLPEGSKVTAMAGGITEPEYGDITRGDLLGLLPDSARLQLVCLSADAAKQLAGQTVRTYMDSLTEYAPDTEDVYVITDSVTLASLDTAEYTLLRDYGDVFWTVRMNINDVTNNYNDPFVLPEAPTLGVGRR